MALPPTPSATADWRAEIAALARAEDNGEIEVYIPGKPGAFNPVTDEYDGAGSTPDTILLTRRSARIQDLAFSQQNGGGDPRAVQRYRFQTDPDSTPKVVTDVAMVRVKSCTNDPTLVGNSFPVTTSSITARLTIESVVERAGVADG